MSQRTRIPPDSVGAYAPPAKRTPVLRQLAEGAALATFVGSIIGAVCGFVGIKLTGPSHELAGVESRAMARDTVQTRSIDSLGVKVTANTERITRVETRQDLQMYMLCIITRRVAPDAVPDNCGTRPASPSP